MDIQSSPIQRAESTSVNTFITRVYGWMSFGLMVTFVVALILGNAVLENSELYNFVSNIIPFVFLLELGIVIILSAFSNKLSIFVSGILFTIYAFANGVFFSAVFAVYTESSIALSFLATSGTFIVMAAYGYVTKQDLTKWGNLAIMGLFGLIIASLLNIFFASDSVSWMLTYLGIGIFLILVAYDTQKIKNFAQSADMNANFEKLALYAALALYLDFINLFIRILRIFGKRR